MTLKERGIFLLNLELDTLYLMYYFFLKLKNAISILESHILFNIILLIISGAPEWKRWQCALSAISRDEKITTYATFEIYLYSLTRWRRGVLHDWTILLSALCRDMNPADDNVICYISHGRLSSKTSIIPLCWHCVVIEIKLTNLMGQTVVN